MTRLIIFLSSFLFPAIIQAQGDSTLNISSLDTSSHFNFQNMNFEVYTSGMVLYTSEIMHYPSEEHYANIEKYPNLIGTKPTKDNLIIYFNLARSLWEESRNEDAKQMFLEIESSKHKLYKKTIHHTSDVPGDTSSNVYGYGSFTSNYKHDASLYLAKIYIEERSYKAALKYINRSQKKYKTEHNCGTGYNIYMSEIYSLYGMTLAPLNKNKKIIKLFMPDCFTSTNDFLINAIRHKYSSKKIYKQLTKAERRCKFRSPQEGSYDHSTCTTRLFKQKIYLPYPSEYFLIDDQAVTKELFIKEFEDSDFYKAITE